MAWQRAWSTVFGGSGFIGRYVVQRLARQGWIVRVAVRRPDRALFLKPMGDRRPDHADRRQHPRRALGRRRGRRRRCGRQPGGHPLRTRAASSFKAIHVEGARAGRARRPGGGREDASCRCRRSAPIADSPADYARSKAAGEAAVREPFPDGRSSVRPSIVFGPEDDFFNRFAAMARLLAGAAADRRRQDAVPAGLCRRRRRGDRCAASRIPQPPARPMSSAGPARLQLPRADGAAAAGDRPPPAAGCRCPSGLRRPAGVRSAANLPAGAAADAGPGAAAASATTWSAPAP